MTSSTHDLVGNGNGSNLSDGINGNRVGTSARPIDPLLGPLQDNGGPTQTMALLPGSPAINAGDPALAPAADQCGIGRVSLPEIGAFEYTHAILVTTTADEDNGTPAAAAGSGTSLREAINFANNNPGADTITFQVAGTITIADFNPLPAFTDPATTTVRGEITLDAHDRGPVMGVNAGASAAFSGLTLVNGKDVSGAGILYNAGTLSLTDCTISGGTSFIGGGIRNVGTLTLTACTISGNVGLFGGGLYNSGTATLTGCVFSGNSAVGPSHDGGAIYNVGTLTVAGSTLTGNSAAHSGGAIFNAGTLTVANCTLSDNTASGDGGAILNAGTLAVANSTLSDNTAGLGGGVYNTGTLMLINATLSDNTAGAGGGIFTHSSARRSRASPR